MKQAVNSLIGAESLLNPHILIVAAIAAWLNIGCTANISSNNQPTVNKTSLPPLKGDVKVPRRTRERQGTLYNSASVPIGSQNILPKLKIGVLPTQNLTEQQQTIEPLDDYLETSLGRQVDFFIAKDYEEIIDWLIKEQLDLAYLGPLAYLKAVDKGAKIQPLVTSIDKYTGQPWYRACIIVKSNSSIKNLQNLKGKRVAFVNKSSTSGYLMPLATFRKQNIDPEQDFSGVIYTGNHSKSMTALEDGTVDAIATNISSYLTLQKSGIITPQNYRIIWQSAPIPNFPIVVSEKLPPELIQQLKRVFISTPEGIKDILGIESSGYTLVSPDDYIPIQELRQELNSISLPQQ